MKEKLFFHNVINIYIDSLKFKIYKWHGSRLKDIHVHYLSNLTFFALITQYFKQSINLATPFVHDLIILRILY